MTFAIAASVRSPDLMALAIAAGWTGYEQIVCIVNAGVDVATLTVTGFPDYLLTLNNKGRIGGVFNSGTGLIAACKFNLDNSLGVIFGGGGKGGAGGTIYISNDNGYDAEGSAGGGGNGAGFTASGAVLMLAAASGGSGSTVEIGGPSVGGSTTGWSRGGDGGAGGAIGQTGSSGSAGTSGGSYVRSVNYAASSGAAAGYAIDGIANVNRLADGSILGRTR